MIMPKLTPKGMRDFLPEEMIFREEIIQKITKVYQRYGFVPLETPAMEYKDTLAAKAGEAIKREIFLIEGGEYGLRFDLTVPLARVAATNAFAKPFKRYCISRVWRHEEPQKGRFREFWQCDADIIGTPSMKAEVELIRCAVDALNEIGFEKPTILINNRKIMNGLAEKLNVHDKLDELLRIIDKIDKLGEKGVREHLAEHFSKEVIDQVFKLIKTTGSNEEKLKNAKVLSEEGAKELEEILNLTKGINMVLDLSLVRGLGYYTGPVFEIKLSDEIGSCGGGGRYDNLLSTYGQGDCATGISLGLERILYLLNERKQETKKTFTKLFIAPVKPELFGECEKLAHVLRKAGIPTEVDINERNLKKQLEYANAMGIQFVVVVGEKEIQSKKYALKNMKDGKSTDATLEQVKQELLKHCE